MTMITYHRSDTRRTFSTGRVFGAIPVARPQDTAKKGAGSVRVSAGSSALVGEGSAHHRRVCLPVAILPREPVAHERGHLAVVWRAML